MEVRLGQGWEEVSPKWCRWNVLSWSDGGKRLGFGELDVPGYGAPGLSTSGIYFFWKEGERLKGFLTQGFEVQRTVAVNGILSSLYT